MKTERAYMLILITLFLCTGVGSLFAQLEYPGSPTGDLRGMKAAEVMYVLPPLDPLYIESLISTGRESTRKSLQFAIERPVQLSPRSNGGWTELDGTRIWRVHIISPGAYSMGLLFNEYRLSEGVRLFVYDPDRIHVKGAFTKENNKASGLFATGHMPGDELIIELQVPDHLEDYGSLNIESVSHAYLDAGSGTTGLNPTGTFSCPPGVFGCSQPCEIDINCTEGDDWQLTKRSVVRIETLTQFCTGVLVNNSAYDETPYVLTAEHCISNRREAATTVFVFGYESPSCFGENGSLEHSISGSQLIAVGDSIDFSLVRLSVTPPESFDAYFAGWDLSDFQSTGTTTIHHPWGDVKKISMDDDIPSVPAQAGDVPYADLQDYYYYSYWWIRRWDTGSTEGGSSGSPLFNEGQRIIGTLTGGVARCGDSIGYDTEKDRIIYNNALNYNDYYTKISYSWDYYQDQESSLKPWLDPVHSGTTTIGGLLPTGMPPDKKAPGERFRIFPVPVSGILYVTRIIPEQGGVRYTVYNLAGNPVISGILEDGSPGEVRVGPLDPGVYTIRLDDRVMTEVKKFVISR